VASKNSRAGRAAAVRWNSQLPMPVNMRSAMPLSEKMTLDEYAIGKQWGATLGEDECPFEDKASDWGWHVALDLFHASVGQRLAARQTALGDLALRFRRQAGRGRAPQLLAQSRRRFGPSYRVRNPKANQHTVRSAGDRLECCTSWPSTPRSSCHSRSRFSEISKRKLGVDKGRPRYTQGRDHYRCYHPSDCRAQSFQGSSRPLSCL
jgi:hypothetical protein